MHRSLQNRDSRKFFKNMKMTAWMKKFQVLLNPKQFFQKNLTFKQNMNLKCSSKKKSKRNAKNLEKRRSMMKSARRYAVLSQRQIIRKTSKKFRQGIFLLEL